MKNSLYIAIISILFSFVTDITMPTPIFLPFEVNDGETKYIASIIPKIWIYTKIKNDSQIIMDITCHDEKRIINKEDIHYSKYYYNTNSTEFNPISSFFSKNNQYKIAYDISKDKNDYGVLQIENLGIGQRLTIKVKVVSKTVS